MEQKVLDFLLKKNAFLMGYKIGLKMSIKKKLKVPDWLNIFGWRGNKKVLIFICFMHGLGYAGNFVYVKQYSRISSSQPFYPWVPHVRTALLKIFFFNYLLEL